MKNRNLGTKISPAPEPRRTEEQVDATLSIVLLEETARLDEVEIVEYLKVARDFPEFFRPGPA
jgi:hypothetical protein